MAYLSGFSNYHQSEAEKGALPLDQNNPQHCPLGLYAEQLSGTAFTRPRHLNLHSWLYRILPSVAQGPYQPFTEKKKIRFACEQAPNPQRWFPLNPPQRAEDFLQSLFPMVGNSLAELSIYQANLSMERRYFSNHDGDLLFIPYQGELKLHTECGILDLRPGHIAVIPRGIFFKVDILSPIAAGYLCENRKGPFTLPALGPIGANGLANPRHFLYPKAAYEQNQASVELITKHQDHWWVAESAHSPLNVVAWQGNYAPYIYDLALFNSMNSVSFDHPDPSIFTVLTVESAITGVANLDFVIFPPRWLVSEHSFRPPYYHRNVMSECMGLIEGVYDAKKEGFLPGGLSIHNAMTAHGPDKKAYEDAIQEKLLPQRYEATLAFMLESRKPWKMTQPALANPSLQSDYASCWQDLNLRFKSKIKEV